MTSWPIEDTSRILREYLSAEQFASCCDQRWSTDRRSLLPVDGKTPPRHGTLVYAKQDHTGVLFPRLQSRRARVVLVTAESDVPVAQGAGIPPQVASWFATNANCGGVEALPLGLGNSYCRVTTKADLLARVAGRPKPGFLYANFRVDTNPAERGPLREKFRSSEWKDSVTFPPSDLSAEQYAGDLASHRYVLCPPGNGTDTHRMVGGAHAGTVPVVEWHPARTILRSSDSVCAKS